jgi:hypothetical protein
MKVVEFQTSVVFLMMSIVSVKNKKGLKNFKSALVILVSNEESTLNWMNNSVRGFGEKRQVDIFLSSKDSNIVLNLIGT